MTMTMTMTKPSSFYHSAVVTTFLVFVPLLLLLLAAPTVQVVTAQQASTANNANPNNQPTELVSKNGLLEVTLTVDDLISVQETKIAPAYNGEPCGPTLRVKPGDTLKVTLINNLPKMTTLEQELFNYISNPQNEIDNLTNVTAIYNRLDVTTGNVYNPTYGFWGLNLVNLHFHGADFPSSIENVQEVVDGGGQSKTYTFEIPNDQDTGLFWYHNHVHGTTAHAYMSNLYGFLVIEGSSSNDDDLTESPGIKGSTEVFMMLSEGLVDPVTRRVPPFFPIVGAAGLWYSVTNGYASFETEYTFELGETVLFRVAAAGVEPTIRLFIPGMTFAVVARDGFALPQPEQVDVVEVGDGGRVEFLAKFDTVGTYSMSRQAWGTAIAPNLEACQAAFGPDATYPCISYDIEQLVASITVVEANNDGTTDTGASSSKSLDMDTIVLPPTSERRQVLADQETVGEKTVYMDVDGEFPLFQIPLTGEPGPPGVGFGMNNRLDTPHHSAGEVMAGTCEMWTVISNPPGADHTFHVHGAKYLVLDVDGVAVDEPYWRDTMIVNANITAKVCFDRVMAGDQLLVHCHMPSHMDIGMITRYNVIENDNPPSSAPPSNGLILGHIIMATSLFVGVFFL